MTESTEIQLARLDERMKMLLDRMEENHESHVRTRAWMGQVDRTLHDIGSRVGNVEQSLAKSAPTIEEFVNIKNKVMGAGMMGRWVWLTAGALIGAAFSLRKHLMLFLSGDGP